MPSMKESPPLKDFERMRIAQSSSAAPVTPSTAAPKKSNTYMPASEASSPPSRQYQVTLYSHRGGPNGWKVATVLSELGIIYRTVWIDYAKGEQRNEEFLQICPNGRIPAIIDHANDDFAVWESGAIILYLVNMYDRQKRLWSDDPKVQSQITSWIMFEVSGFGVMQGQAFWFSFFHPERIPSAIKRYVDESRRVYSVLEMRLAERREELLDLSLHASDDSPLSLVDPELPSPDEPVWLVGRTMTAADLSFLTWARACGRIGIDLEAEFPEVRRWVENMLARPKVSEALRPI